MGLDVDNQWILAFDASCGTCRQYSQAVQRVCGGALDLRPLTEPVVHKWRTEAFGEVPPWAPTLLRIRGEQVSAWTGPRMVVPLLRLLGVRSTLRLLAALGALRGGDTGGAGGIGRKEFLRLSAGGALTAVLVLGGGNRALGGTRGEPTLGEAQDWVLAHHDRLPRDYGTFGSYPVNYRRAIFAALPADARRRLWTDHFSHYQDTHPAQSAQRTTVLRAATALVADTFTDTSPDREQRLTAFASTAIAAYGRDEARALVATLGPTPAATPHGVLPGCPSCECNGGDNWCGSKCCVADCYDDNYCVCSNSGCGTFWSYGCNGVCGSPGCPSICVV
jgi:hypothetical protein